MRELCDEAVSAALAADASYADARVVIRRSQTVATRNRRVDRLDDVETQGLGVRVLVGGAWGFACDNELSVQNARATATRACAFAVAAPGSHRRELAPLEPASGEYRTAYEKHPFEVSLADKVAALLRADPCPAGVTTVVIDAEQMELQVHESVGHPTELDRVYGTEAAYAGTSFLSPGDLGSLRYGSERMNITADSTTPGGLGTFGFDDEGVPARREPVVAEGILSGFLTSRETAARIGSGAGGSMRADGWSRMPLVRMTNLNLEPGEGSVEELIAGVDEGVYLQTNKSWSIDDQRLNFQFGTQVAWEIKAGKVGQMLRDATYTGRTPDFWGSLDAVAGPEEWILHGLTNCGKGQPGQHAHVSHGTSPARFRNVQVGFRS